MQGKMCWENKNAGKKRIYLLQVTLKPSKKPKGKTYEFNLSVEVHVHPLTQLKTLEFIIIIRYHKLIWTNLTFNHVSFHFGSLQDNHGGHVITKNPSPQLGGLMERSRKHSTSSKVLSGKTQAAFKWLRSPPGNLKTHATGCPICKLAVSFREKLISKKYPLHFTENSHVIYPLISPPVCWQNLS